MITPEVICLLMNEQASDGRLLQTSLAMDSSSSIYLLDCMILTDAVWPSFFKGRVSIEFPKSFQQKYCSVLQRYNHNKRQIEALQFLIFDLSDQLFLHILIKLTFHHQIIVSGLYQSQIALSILQLISFFGFLSFWYYFNFFWILQFFDFSFPRMKTFTYIHIVATIQGWRFGFHLRFPQTFFWFHKIISFHYIYFLLQIVILFNQKLIHLHQLPIRPFILLIFLFFIPSKPNLIPHFNQHLSIALNKLFLLFLRPSKSFPHLLNKLILFIQNLLHFRNLLLMKLLQFLHMMVIEQSLLVYS